MKSRRRPPAGLIVLVSALAGCGPPRPVLAPRAPHGGVVFDLPGAGGVVEVVREPTPGPPGRARMRLYFLDADLGPMANAPTLATLKPRGRGAAPIEFRPAVDDPSRAGVLECPKVPGQGDVAGELTATVGGRPVALSIVVR